MALLTALAERLNQMNGAGSQPFYCWRSNCDGLPHEGFDYKHARWAQHPPDLLRPAWFIWFLKMGRGGGKTRSGAEWLTDQAYSSTEESFYGVVAPTIDDGRDVCVEGESGLLYVLDRRGIVHNWNKSFGHIDVRNAGGKQSRIETFTDQKPERVRGPNLSAAWVDEPASYVNAMRRGSNPGTWDNLLMTLRKGNPRVVVSGTPKSNPFTKLLIAEAEKKGHVTIGSSYDNRNNLAPEWFEQVIGSYEGTSLAEQEIYGNVLEQQDGALWKLEWLLKVDEPNDRPVQVRIAHDPAVTSHKTSDAHGIIVVLKYRDGSMHVADDRSGVMTGTAAARICVELANHYGAQIVFEGNQGGDVWQELYAAAAKDLDLPTPPSHKYTSIKSKEGRALPVAQMYEQQHTAIADNRTPKKRITHSRKVGVLETELTTWVPGVSKESPNRLDALVIGITDMTHNGGSRAVGASRLADTPQQRPARRRRPYLG